MRIAFIVGAFPVISETFILNQITGLIDRGHDVDIYARSIRHLETPHPQINRYRLLDRTRDLELSRHVKYLGTSGQGGRSHFSAMGAVPTYHLVHPRKNPYSA